MSQLHTASTFGRMGAALRHACGVAAAGGGGRRPGPLSRQSGRGPRAPRPHPRSGSAADAALDIYSPKDGAPAFGATAA